MPAQSPKILVALLALAAALVGTTAAAPPASAAEPCYRQLIKDWYDGRIDRSYPIACYREAIKRLPPDVETYSSAREDFERALQAAIRGNGGRAPTVVPPSGAGRDVVDEEPEETETTGAGVSGGGDEGGGAAGSPEAGGGVLEVFEPANADSIPVPLLVLAGVATLLLAAAATGFVAKRIQERRVPVAPVAPGPGDGPPAPRPPE